MQPNTAVSLQISLHRNTRIPPLSMCPCMCVFSVYLCMYLCLYLLEGFFPWATHLNALAYEYSFMHPNTALCKFVWMCLLLQGFLEALCLAGMNEPVLFLAPSNLQSGASRTHKPYTNCYLL